MERIQCSRFTVSIILEFGSNWPIDCCASFISCPIACLELVYPTAWAYSKLFTQVGVRSWKSISENGFSCLSEITKSSVLKALWCNVLLRTGMFVIVFCILFIFGKYIIFLEIEWVRINSIMVGFNFRSNLLLTYNFINYWLKMLEICLKFTVLSVVISPWNCLEG